MDVVVARIGRPHGLQGEVTVQTHTDEPRARYAAGTAYETQAEPGAGVPHMLTLRSSRLHNGTWLLAFEEIPDRTGAESLRGTRLLVDNEAPLAPPVREPGGIDDASVTRDTEPGEAWYEEQLVGLAVQLPDGTRVGEVGGLEIGAAQDLLVVVLDDGHTAYVPFVGAIVPTVDVDGGRVVIDPPAGLLDLNA